MLKNKQKEAQTDTTFVDFLCPRIKASNVSEYCEMCDAASMISFAFTLSANTVEPGYSESEGDQKKLDI